MQPTHVSYNKKTQAKKWKTYVASAVADLLIDIVVAEDLVDWSIVRYIGIMICVTTPLTFAKNTWYVVVDVDDLRRIRNYHGYRRHRRILTRAWLGSSSVNERRLTSGILTLPKVIPWLMYRTRASLTGKRSCQLIDLIASRTNIHTFDADGSLGLFGAAANMRSKNDVVQATKIFLPTVQAVIEVIAVCAWLARVDVQRSSCNLAAAHCVNQGRNVNYGSAAGIDKIRAVFHLLQLRRGNHVLGFGQLWDVQGDEVGIS